MLMLTQWADYTYSWTWEPALGEPQTCVYLGLNSSSVASQFALHLGLTSDVISAPHHTNNSGTSFSLTIQLLLFTKC